MNMLWCYLFLFITLVHGKSVHQVPPEYAGELLKVAADCIASTNAGADAVQKMISGNIENSATFKKFLHCFSSKSGYIDSNGHFIVDKMTALIGNHKDKSKYIDALNLCNKGEGGHTTETIYKLAVCFKDNSPITLTV